MWRVKQRAGPTEQWETGVEGARGLGEGCQGSVWSSGVQTRASGGEKRRYKSHILSSKAWRKELEDGRRKGGKERSFHDLVSSYCVPSFVLGAGEESAKCRSIFQEGQPGNQHPQKVVVVTRTRTKGDRGAGVGRLIRGAFVSS